MRRTVNASEARAKLFRLIDDVIDHDASTIYIRHRDRSEKVALVRESRLKYLESLEAEVRRDEEPFRLEGSMELLVPAANLEAWLRSNRQEQARLAAEKAEPDGR